MTVTDAFSLGQRGTAVTGTLDKGTLTVGDYVAVVHQDGSETYARILLFHGLDGEDNTAYEGDEVSMLLDIVKKSRVQAGDEVKKLQMSL